MSESARSPNATDEQAVRLYDSMAASYAQHARDGVYNAHYDRPSVLRLCGDVGGMDVLDAGCGPGFYAEALRGRGARVAAFDGSRQMVKLARRRLGDTVEIHHMRLGAPLDFADESFDLAVCALVIHYVSDRRAALSELRRVLRPGGALVLSTQHPTADWLRKGGSYFDVAVEEDVWHRPEGDWAVRYWREPLTSLCEAVHQAGFLIERLVEPLPSSSMRDHSPGDYEKLQRQPGFLNLRLVKNSDRRHH